MVIDTLLQLSWLPAPSSMRTVRPVHDPTPLPPVGTTLAPEEPPIAKSASVHAGLVLSVCDENVWTAAVTELMCTACGFGLSKCPDNVIAVPPGYIPLAVDVWWTVMAEVVPVDAAPEP